MTIYPSSRPNTDKVYPSSCPNTDTVQTESVHHNAVQYIKMLKDDITVTLGVVLLSTVKCSDVQFNIVRLVKYSSEQ